MTRTPPSTSWGDRTPPSTNWAGRSEPTTSRDNARKDLYLEDLTGTNIVDLTGELVAGVSGNETNVIDTPWN